MKSSLTSVTFIKKPMEEIAVLAKEAGLDAIEWAGKAPHVPAGDIDAARKALRLCREQGLTVSGYGSYYYGTPEEDFAPVLACAREMEAPVIRVWAGKGYGPSENYPEDARKRMTECLQKAALEAKAYGITVATEYHNSSMMDNISSAQRLLAEAPDLMTYWQMRTHPAQTTELDLSDISLLGKRLANVHALFWRNGQRELLSNGKEEMTRYLKAVAETGNARYAAIEFTKDDTVENFLADAETLKALLSQI